MPSLYWHNQLNKGLCTFWYSESNDGVLKYAHFKVSQAFCVDDWKNLYVVHEGVLYRGDSIKTTVIGYNVLGTVPVQDPTPNEKQIMLSHFLLEGL